jgi:DNA-binding NarL/FixJ family response regulator
VILLADDRATGHGLHARHTWTLRRDPGGDASRGHADVSSTPLAVATPNPLTMREREVLGMMVHGLRNKEIADLLFITDRTVKFHAQAIYRKLDVANRTEAVCVALRRGIVALDPPVPLASDAA